MDYKGFQDKNEKNNEPKYFEFGAHFKYSELVKALKNLQEKQNSKKEKNLNNNSNSNSNNSNYNILYNKINKQLCEKMSDIISPNKLIQSRNIKPLIQSLSQKLTDIVQSQNNKKAGIHNEPKNRYINSNYSIKQKIKNNIIMKNNAIKNLKSSKNNTLLRGEIQNFINKCPSSSKPINLSISRNYFTKKNIKITNKNNNKNMKFNNKKNNLTSEQIKDNKLKRYQSKNINTNNYINNNDNLIYGQDIENNNNKQNINTIQNIIVKPNINISFINNYNTTFLKKSKKKKSSPKKIRSRNNQQISKLNMIENQLINCENQDEIEDNCINYQNNRNHNYISNKKKMDIIFLKKKLENINLKEIHRKSPLDKHTNKNIKINDNSEKKNIIQEKIIKNINAKLINNLNQKNKTTNKLNKIFFLNNGNTNNGNIP